MDLSIVIVSYNTKRLTLNCLASIRKYTKALDYEIIVVDNASTDGSRDVLKRLHNRKEIKLFLNGKNLGFGPANNQGLASATGDFVLFLNSDTKVSSNLLGEIVDWLAKRPKVGLVSCALKNKDGSYQETGGHFPTLPRVFAWMVFLDDLPIVDKLIKPFHPMHSQSPFYQNASHYTSEKEVDWLTGAFLLFRKSVLAEIGGFDEGYFMYTEDVDICFRVKRAGWKVVYSPKWSIIHLGGKSSSKGYPILREYDGIKTFYKKHMPSWQFLVLRLLLKFGAVLRMITLGPLKGGEVLRTYAKAFKEA